MKKVVIFLKKLNVDDELSFRMTSNGYDLVEGLNSKFWHIEGMVQRAGVKNNHTNYAKNVELLFAARKLERSIHADGLNMLDRFLEYGWMKVDLVEQTRQCRILNVFQKDCRERDNCTIPR